MLILNNNLKPYSIESRNYEDLKSLSRYRFNKVKYRAKLKTSVARLVNILFPEIESIVSTLHLSSILALLYEFPGASYVSNANLTHLSNFLYKASKGRLNKDFCIKLRNLAKNSIGSIMYTKSLELKHTIKDIMSLNDEIDEIDMKLKIMIDDIKSPIMSILGISYSMASLILGEIGDINKFDNPDKLLAFSGMSPSIYQSGQLDNCYPKMEKRCSTYLNSIQQFMFPIGMIILNHIF